MHIRVRTAQADRQRRGRLAATRLGGARSEAGAAVVELALLSPLLFLLLLGTLDLGRMVYLSIEVDHAARAGAQYGAQDHIRASDTAGITLAATNDAPNISGLSVNASHFCRCADGTTSSCLATDCTGSQMYEFIQVQTSASYSAPVPFPLLGVSARTVNGTSILRVDQ